MDKALYKALGLVIILMGAASLTGCGSMPKHNETTIDKASAIIFKGGPVGAALMVDGERVGTVAPRKRETAVNVKDGSHQVVVTGPSGDIIYQRTVLVDDGIRKIIDLGKP